jgi:hypothetical protein
MDRTRMSRQVRATLALAVSVVMAGCSGANATMPVVIITGAAPSLTPGATAPRTGPAPTSPASACSGDSETKAFFAEAAAMMSFDVYCAVLPPGWAVDLASRKLSATSVEVIYRNGSTQQINLDEGAFCTTGVVACSQGMSDLGVVPFGDTKGELVQTNASPSYAVYVQPGTAKAYMMYGSGVTRAQFVAWAAAVVKVPKT